MGCSCAGGQPYHGRAQSVRLRPWAPQLTRDPLRLLPLSLHHVAYVPHRTNIASARPHPEGAGRLLCHYWQSWVRWLPTSDTSPLLRRLRQAPKHTVRRPLSLRPRRRGAPSAKMYAETSKHSGRCCESTFRGHISILSSEACRLFVLLR